MEINITWNICRVCLQEEMQNNKDIKSTQKHQSIFCDDKLAKNIFQCSGVMMKANDGMPEKICPKCMKILKYAIYFRKTCRQSDANLQSVVQRTKSASSMFKQERRKDSLDDSQNAEDDPIYYDVADVVEDGQTSEVHNHSGEEEEEHSESCNQSHRHKQNPLELHAQKKIKPYDDEKNRRLESGRLALKYEIEENSVDSVIIHDEEVGSEIDEVLEQDLNQTNTPGDGDNIYDPPQHTNAETDHEEQNVEQSLKLKGDPLSFSKLGTPTQSIVRKIMEESEELTDDDASLDDNEIVQLGNEERANNDLKVPNDGLYFILNTIKENDHSNKHHEVIGDADDGQTLDDNVDFVPIEDDEMQNIVETHEDIDDDNRSQVTSTVVTKEEIDIEDASSNLSQNTQDIDTEFIVDEYIIDDCSPNLQHNKPLIHANISMNAKAKHFRKTPAIRRRHGNTQANSTSQHCTCELCGNNFNSRQLMNIHMKIHRQEKSHECELCFKRFITACNLQAHMRIHTGEKPYECKFCGRRFSDRSTHIRHERIHTNEKPFSCDNCGKSFALATTLQAHLKVHTGERPYRCELCAKSFKLAHQLKAHKNTSLHKAVEEQLGHDYLSS